MFFFLPSSCDNFFHTHASSNRRQHTCSQLFFSLSFITCDKNGKEMKMKWYVCPGNVRVPSVCPQAVLAPSVYPCPFRVSIGRPSIPANFVFPHAVRLSVPGTLILAPSVYPFPLRLSVVRPCICPRKVPEFPPRACARVFDPSLSLKATSGKFCFFFHR